MGISLNEISRLGAAAQRQIAEKLLNQKQTADVEDRKYHNAPAERITPEGKTIAFDSQKEARRFDELLQLLRTGQIEDLRLQHQITLQEAYTMATGQRVRAIRYVADFSYLRDGERIYEDTKGHRTEVYKLKKKLCAERRGIDVKEV
ncbi:MAG: DUF1064 domain-containing protein [Oscillospiraceae bacterium]|nr:DUF1064 domain-containing protein [Oscillospiraceae bacterium]